MKVLIFIASDPVWTIPAEHAERLRQRFPHHRFVNVAEEREALEAIADSEAAFSSIITPDLFTAAPRLRWVHSPAAGIGRMLFPEMVASDVILTNSRGLHAVPIAEHVVGLAIALARQFHVAVRRQAEHVWAKAEIGAVRVLHGRRLGLVGLGEIGSATARLAAALGMKVSAVRRRPDAPVPAGVERVYPPSGLDMLLSESDYVVLAAPFTAETHGLIGARELRLMKRTAFLINIARGKLVREADLAEALRAGTIAGAGLDVFAHEPLEPSSPLWDLPNAIITPHTSGFFEGYFEAATELFARNLELYDRGEPLLNVVDKQVGY